MYKVETKHLHQGWERGDSCADFELISVETFKTRKAAKEYIEDKLKGKSNIRRHYTKGDTWSYCIWFTGNKFFSEANGDTYDEYYQYDLKKI